MRDERSNDSRVQHAEEEDETNERYGEEEEHDWEHVVGVARCTQVSETHEGQQTQRSEGVALPRLAKVRGGMTHATASGRECSTQPAHGSIQLAGSTDTVTGEIECDQKRHGKEAREGGRGKEEGLRYSHSPCTA